jgi:transketolase C-terminal domain/subunit
MVYALARLQFVRVSAESGGNSNSDSETGINIGTGGECILSFAKLFAEIKFDVGAFEQLNIGAGLGLPIGNYNYLVACYAIFERDGVLILKTYL